MICAWMLTSSAEIGSSATMNSGSHRERARDADALALAAGEFVRIAVRRRREQADHVEQFARRARVVCAPRRRDAVKAQRLGEDLADASCAD